MNPSDQLILDCFNSKLYHLYNYPVTSKTVKDGQGVVDVPPCALGVCELLRTYKRRIAGGTLALDFDLPKLVYDQSREEYQVKISIRSFSSPTIPAGCPATGSFKVDLVRKKFFQGEQTDFHSPAYMVMHILDFQNAERRLAQFQSDHHNISKNMLKDILHEYAQSLHEGGISTLLAQACPSFGMNGHKPPVPGSPSTDVSEPSPTPPLNEAAINTYVKIAWQIIIEKLQGRKEENTVEVFNGRRIRLTFSGPPIVSYAPRAGNTYFNFKFAGFAPTDGSKGSASFSVSFTVGGSASYENQGVLNTERINIDYTRPSCNRPDGMLEEPWLSDVILTIRDEYIPFLWECGFDTLYASLNWKKAVERMSSLPMLPKVSHDPLMHGWDFVVAVSQESINTNLVTGDAVRRTVQRRDGGASFDARFAASRIELLSANQAILWICVEPGFQSNGKDDRHRQVISEPLQLAFHVHLKLKSTSPVSATGRSVWEIYIGTANVSFLPQYSVLHLGDDGVDSGYHTLRDLIDFTATSFIPSLSANKQNVVVRIPILDAAAGSSSPYTMVNAQFRTAFGRRRATVDTVTVENWHETMSQPRTFSPIILVYGTQPGAIRAPATPPSWNSWSPRADVINGLSIGTLAIAKDAQIVERVIPAQLARLNAITTLVPMVHLGYKYSCPGMVYLESSGDGTNAADGMWQPVQAVDAVHSASRTYVYQSTSSCTTTTVVNGVTERTQTYTCKTTNKLTMSNMFSPELAITMTGNIELSCSDSKATASLTWKWDIVQPTHAAKPRPADALLSSMATVPEVLNEVSQSGPHLENMSTKGHKAEVMAKRLKAAFHTIVKNANLPDPIAGMPAFRYNDNGDLLVELYSGTSEDAHPGMNGSGKV